MICILGFSVNAGKQDMLRPTAGQHSPYKQLEKMDEALFERQKVADKRVGSGGPALASRPAPCLRAPARAERELQQLRKRSEEPHTDSLAIGFSFFDEDEARLADSQT